MLVSALSSVLGKSVSEFNALPRSERPAKLRAVLRSKWMWTNPPAAVAARALAATDAGVNAAVNALEKYGAGAVALGTEAAHAAAEKHLAKNPRSGGRMARVRIAPSIPTYALDRLDVTRARRNGANPTNRIDATGVYYDLLTAMDGWTKSMSRDYDTISEAKKDARAYYAANVSDLARHYGVGVSTVARMGPGLIDTFDTIREKFASKTRRNGYSRRRNCGGDCACAPCQAAARSNPLSVVGGAGPFPEGMVVEHPGVKPMARLKAAINRIDIARTSSEAHRAYGQAHRVYESLKRAGVYIHPSLFSDIGFSYTDKLRSIPLTPEEELEAEKARLYPPRKRGARRNHHIRVGGTFYTPGGRRGTVLEEARGGYYRVRWSDGTVGTVQDNEWAAYPTAGSRVNPARSPGYNSPLNARRGPALGSREFPMNMARQAIESAQRLAADPDASLTASIAAKRQARMWLESARQRPPMNLPNRGAARSNGTETKYYGYRLYFGKPTQNKWAGDFATREQAQAKADEMIGEYGEPSDGIRIVKYRAQLRRK